MARTKVRTIEAATVLWHANGMREAITRASVTHKPNGFAADCWICGQRCETAAGVVVFVDVASLDKALAGVVHNGEGDCVLKARDRAFEINRGARSPADALPMGAPQDPPSTIAQEPRSSGGSVGDDPPKRPATSTSTADPRDTFRAWLGVGESVPVDESTVRAIVSEMLDEQQAARPVVVLRVGDRPEVVLPDSRHAMMEEALCRITCPKRMLWLVGPTGTGKTFLARQLADVLGVRYFEQACYGASESALVGFATADGTYIATPVVAAVDYTSEEGSKGALLCLDELDGADESALLALNSLLAGDGVATPRRARQGHTHRGSAPLYIVATTNTEGTSYGTREYNARTKFDDATRDRLVRVRLPIDYDENVERAIVAGNGLPEGVATALWLIRKAVREHKLESRHVSTRAFEILGEMNATHPGRWSEADLIEMEIGTWTDEERAKVGYPRRTR